MNNSYLIMLSVIVDSITDEFLIYRPESRKHLVAEQTPDAF